MGFSRHGATVPAACKAMHTGQGKRMRRMRGRNAAPGYYDYRLDCSTERGGNCIRPSFSIRKVTTVAVGCECRWDRHYELCNRQTDAQKSHHPA